MRKILIIAIWLLIAFIAKSQNTAPLPTGNTTIGNHLSVGASNEVWSNSTSLFFNYRGNVKVTYFWNLKGSKGTPILSLLDSGNVGIGTRNPNAKLHIPFGDVIIGGNKDQKNTLNSTLFLKSKSTDAHTFYIGHHSSGSDLFWVKGDGNSYLKGKLGIGTNTPTQKLDVNGTIRANEIIVSNPSTADFVFEKNYKLKSLREVEQFIKKNKHLPDVASAKQMKKNGVKQGEMNAKLLQKIEELTLYMIQLKKENEKLKSRIEKLEE